MADGKGSASSSSKPVPAWLNSSVWHSNERPVRSSSLSKSVSQDEPEQEVFTATGESVSGRGSAESQNEKGPTEEWRKDRERMRESTAMRSSNFVFGSSNGGGYGGLRQDRSEKSAAPWEETKTSSGAEPREPPVIPHMTDNAALDAFSGNDATSFRGEDDRLEVERKTARFYSELAQQKIKITELRRLAMTGIPNEGSLRATTWKLLLGYLPCNSENWEAELARKRVEYAEFREEFIINPTEVARRKEAEAMRASRRSMMQIEDEQDWSELRGIDATDHPLSQGPSSIWHQYFKDTELVEQIDRDVKRTHPDLPFFNSEDGSAAATQDAMRRILFVFAKLNPGIRYVQGMNEVLAPLLYIFSTDPDIETAAHAEPDAFYCFSALLGDFRDHFCQQLDNSVVGIRSTISRVVEILRIHDPELWRHLEFVSKVNPQFYAFRWITLLLTQDFEFFDVIRIWDSLLANTDGPLEILLRICCAMLICIRERLLAGDFTMNLKLLQRYPPTDIEGIIDAANQLKAPFAS